MSRNYSLNSFFRQMPNALLVRYFDAQGVVHGLDAATLPEVKLEQWLEVWNGIDDSKRPAIEADFREIHALSTEKGTLAILDELRWQLQDRPEELQAATHRLAELGSHQERAMLALLDYPTCWGGALRFFHADSLSSWRKRKNLPKKDAAVDAASIQELSDLIGGYFHHTEGRGRHCKVEPYRRGERDYFFAYPEDHSSRSMEWAGGEFQPRPHNPAFEVVFVYSKAEGTLDISCKGAPKALEAMQGIFAQAILKLAELPPDPKDQRVYELGLLAQKSFEFTYSPTSGIKEVAVKKIRLTSKARRSDRITVEADPTSDRHAVHKVLEQISRSTPLHLFEITQVELVATMHATAGRRAKRVTIRITHPNSCSLKYDDLDLRLRDMLEASGIEPVHPHDAAIKAA